jgi:DNA-directed RNA polymerase specialized sigma24 family protein
MSTSAPRAEPTSSLCELASKPRHGHHALELLLQRCRPIIYALVLDRVHNPEVAEDLTQEVLTEVAQSVRKLRDPRAW